MRSIGGLALVVAAGLLSACASWRWSGHPAVTASSSPPRSGAEGRETRSYGLPLHAASEKPPLGVSGVKDAAPFLPKVPLTPSEHMEAGRAYLDMADRHRQEAAAHFAMKQLYGEDREMAAHCDRLIEQLSALAVQYEDISIIHEKKAADLSPRLK